MVIWVPIVPSFTDRLGARENAAVTVVLPIIAMMHSGPVPEHPPPLHPLNTKYCLCRCGEVNDGAMAVVFGAVSAALDVTHGAGNNTCAGACFFYHEDFIFLKGGPRPSHPAADGGVNTQAFVVVRVALDVIIAAWSRGAACDAVPKGAGQRVLAVLAGMEALAYTQLHVSGHIPIHKLGIADDISRFKGDAACSDHVARAKLQVGWDGLSRCIEVILLNDFIADVAIADPGCVSVGDAVRGAARQRGADTILFEALRQEARHLPQVTATTRKPPFIYDLFLLLVAEL